MDEMLKPIRDMTDEELRILTNMIIAEEHNRKDARVIDCKHAIVPILRDLQVEAERLANAWITHELRNTGKAIIDILGINIDTYTELFGEKSVEDWAEALSQVITQASQELPRWTDNPTPSN